MRQTQLVTAAVQGVAPGARVAVKTVTTRGDRDRTAPLTALGGIGAFAKELEEALLDGRIDVAVHSMKDLPSEGTPGLAIAAVPVREDARDALLSRRGERLWDLPAGARVGTSSPRRRAQLLHLRRDLDVADLRGNLDTRLHRLDEGRLDARRLDGCRLDAILLAAAGLRRLGLEGRVTELLPLSAMLPAAGQGALAIQIRAEDARLARLLAPLDDPPSRIAVEAERAFLRRIGGGCHVPAGAYARKTNGHLECEACIAVADGSRVVRDWTEGDWRDPEGLGTRLAEALLSKGGAEVLWDIKRA